MSPKIFAIANLSLSFVFNDFHTILVFTVNWDYSKQLLICRDFASNLGPLLVDKNPVFFFASSIPQKPTEFFSKLWLLRVQKPIIQCDITKFVAGHNTRNPLEMTSTRHWYCRNCCPTLTSYSATYTCFCYSQILQPSNQPHLQLSWKTWMNSLRCGAHFNIQTHGDEILDWILSNNLHVLNDGSARQTSRITGNDSTPE